MARLLRVCLKCDWSMVNTDDEFEACANTIDGEPCGSMEWAVVPMPDADLTLTRDDRSYLRSIRIDPD